MAFDDLAKRMRETHGSKLGDTSGTTDADQLLGEAKKADRRADIIRDLVLGPILLMGGSVVAILGFPVLVQTTRAGEFIWWLDVICLAGFAALLIGPYRIIRGFVRLLKRSLFAD